MSDEPQQCAARVSIAPGYWDHDRCKRRATTADGLCAQHQKLFEKFGFVACTTGYNGRVSHRRIHTQEGEMSNAKKQGTRPASYLTTVDFARLNHACQVVWEAFGGETYLVGSVLVGDSWHDVDVRTILDDDTFDAIFHGRQFFWSLTCLGIATYLRQVTGLPIDYQIQRRTEANAKHDGIRNAIGTRARPFAGGGDATSFGER